MKIRVMDLYLVDWGHKKKGTINMGFQHENLEPPHTHTFFFTVSEGMHYSNASIYKHNEILKHEGRDQAHTLVNTKSLLCLCVKFPMIIPREWVGFNYHIHLWLFKWKVSHPVGKDHLSRHLTRTVYTPHTNHFILRHCVTMTCIIGGIQ